MEYSDEPVSESATRGFLSTLIEPSITTLRHLSIEFDTKHNTVGCFDFGMLKAAEALRSFAFESYGADGDVVDDVFLGGRFPLGVNALKLRWGFGRSSVPPAFEESFVACFAQLPNLTTLILELDFEKAANDTNFMVRTMKAIDLSWVNRCLHRRLRATKALVDACPTLETVMWTQDAKDIDNRVSVKHIFRVTGDGARRTVRTLWNEGWMGDEGQRDALLPDDIDHAPFDLGALYRCYGFG